MGMMLISLCNIGLMTRVICLLSIFSSINAGLVWVSDISLSPFYRLCMIRGQQFDDKTRPPV